MKLLFQGLRLGMLLQLAIGPLCLLVFETAAAQGFFAALLAVCAIALVDALYIALSLLGVAALLQKARVRTAVKWAGCAVLVLFGVSAVLGALGVSLLPALSLFSNAQGQGVFIKALLLTASNPLTILFWGGVLSARAAEHGYARGELTLFAAGCVCATLLFLTAVAALGGMAGGFLPEIILRALNAAVGLALIYFGIRLATREAQCTMNNAK